MINYLLINNSQFIFECNCVERMFKWTLMRQKRGCDLAFFSVVASSPNLSTLLPCKSTETILNTKKVFENCNYTDLLLYVDLFVLFKY